MPLDFLSVLILSIVEGLTEFLPVSSTGHLILASGLLGLQQTEFLKTFEIAIQSGAILSVVAFYWRSFLDAKLLKRIFVAFVPTAAVGLALYGFFKNTLLASPNIVAWSLLAGGIAIILFEKFHGERKNPVTDLSSVPVSKFFLIGLAQSVSIIPGVSRAAATIIGGMFLGISRQAIVKFSFLLAVPTLIVATGYDLAKSSHVFSAQETLFLAAGFAFSFIAAALAIRLFLSFIKNRNLSPFGYYRLAVGLLWLLVFSLVFLA